jgi:prepilin-type N-terminal cleavage/methylation domain-containing protein
MNLVPRRPRGFTLLETVIAIGVLAVLLGAFLVVFGPATANIRRSISAQEADRLASAFVNELGNLRPNQKWDNGFDKAFTLLQETATAGKTMFVYQYRADPSKPPRTTDGTMEPYPNTTGMAGKDYVIQAVMRQRDDPLFAQDLAAVEGRVFAVKATQLINDQGTFKAGTIGTIADPETGAAAASAEAYPGATIAFAAEFFDVPSTAPGYLKSGGAFDLSKLKSPLFTRNLAVNR